LSLWDLLPQTLWGCEADKLLSIELYELAGHNIAANQKLHWTFSVLTSLSIVIFVSCAMNVALLVAGREFYSDYEPQTSQLSYFPTHYQKSSREDASLSLSKSTPKGQRASLRSFVSPHDLARRKRYAYSYQSGGLGSDVVDPSSLLYDSIDEEREVDEDEILNDADSD
jgi:hypothetical protein